MKDAFGAFNVLKASFMALAVPGPARQRHHVSVEYAVGSATIDDEDALRVFSGGGS